MKGITTLIAIIMFAQCIAMESKDNDSNDELAVTFDSTDIKPSWLDLFSAKFNDDDKLAVTSNSTNTKPNSPWGLLSSADPAIYNYIPTITDKNTFDYQEDENKWIHYKELLFHYQDLREKNKKDSVVKQDLADKKCQSEQALAAIRAELEKVRKSDLEKEKEIDKLKEESQKTPWKTIGFTFLSTVTGMIIGGKLIDKK